MKVRLVVIGKPRTPGVIEAIAEYERRAARYWPLEVRVCREAPGRSLAPAQVRATEWERLAAACGQAFTVVCDAGGRSMTSEEFASWLDARRKEATDVAFVIGGAHGLAPAARAGAGLVLSLAPWTLAHELARLVLAEQLYRAGTIVRGEPYHK